MTGDLAAHARPLRNGDPERLGDYKLVGRLGEGGMGSVFLAVAPDGTHVAVKVIRADLADDGDFRRRFRGEVTRAREVPPFCTAEVIDADPDHDPPYLVVEYVDGPSLAVVVDERGPLTPANLHALAIGVATALTAIHGAGVIHRDLKPSNVLLAPGSPKVIDFGIARGLDGTGNHTRTDQVIGTVAYMAPERFALTSAAQLTTAADIFAWGAVVAYAGTGRTPFAAESQEATAVRIMTQPPDLEGLRSGPLRDLVLRALAKDPADRPTARELLDGLLIGGRGGPSKDMAAALASQPELREAAEGAQAATTVERPAIGGLVMQSTKTMELRDGTPGGGPGGGAAGGSLATIAPPGATAPGEPTVIVMQPRRGGRSGSVLITTLSLAVLLMAGTVVGIITGKIPLANGQGPGPTQTQTSPPGSTGSPSASASASPSASASASASESPSGPPSPVLVVDDSLSAAGNWHAINDAPNKTTCSFNNALVVETRLAQSYRCPGPTTAVGDFTLSVDVRLIKPGSCAAVWFRFTDSNGGEGYALRICPDGYHLVGHQGANVTFIHDFRFLPHLALNTVVKVGIVVKGTSIDFFRDGMHVGGYADTTYQNDGRVVLGIFQYLAGAPANPDYIVSFANVKITTP
jgi:eukaryotic-like serine/threonine-protein kinase